LLVVVVVERYSNYFVNFERCVVIHSIVVIIEAII